MHENPNPTLDKAREYRARGWMPIPVAHKEKGCKVPGWPALRLGKAELRERFATTPMNVAILVGEPSGWLIDIDMDCPEAGQLAAELMPETAVFGRKSNPDSHWLYRSEGAKTAKFEAPGGSMLLEVRSTGASTVFPPSTHPSGEAVTWARETEPAVLPASELGRLASRLAAAALLAQKWPAKGSRNDAALALAGCLLRGGWTLDDARRFIVAVADTAGDEEAPARGAVVTGTRAKLDAGESVTGWPRLAELIGEEAAAKVGTWLGLSARAGATPSTAAKGADSHSQADVLASLVVGADLFHDRNERAYITVDVDGHEETYPVDSKSFVQWLRSRFYRQERKAPYPAAVQDAQDLVSARAVYDGPRREVFVRVGQTADALYLDLGNERGEVVEVTAKEWRICARSPVKFRRPTAGGALPTPTRGGSLDLLNRHINVKAAHDLLLVKAWLLACLRPGAPMPILALHGEQGSAKTTTAEALLSLIDPQSPMLRSPPRDTRDLMIAAERHWVLGFDNLSQVRADLADDLCRLVTGGGVTTRALYTDADEVAFEAMRPLLMTAIGEVSARADLLDRMLLVYLPPIPKHERTDLASIKELYQRDHAPILGALLDVAVAALAELPGVPTAGWERMADFGRWSTAAGVALAGDREAVADAIRLNGLRGTDVAIEDSPVAAVLPKLLKAPGAASWEGTCTDLLAELNELEKPSGIPRGRRWPSDPRTLSNELRRLEPALRERGITIVWPRTHGSAKVLTLTWSKPGATPPTPA